MQKFQTFIGFWTLHWLSTKWCSAWDVEPRSWAGSAVAGDHGALGVSLFSFIHIKLV